MSEFELPPPGVSGGFGVTGGFGGSPGPLVDTSELLALHLAGGRTGRSPDASLEGPLLRGGHEPLAIRVGEHVVLVRDHVPDDVETVRAALFAAMSDAGMDLVEEDTPLAGIVEIEVVGRRGDAWSLWARDPDQGRAALVSRAAGDMPGLLEWERAQREKQERMDATLSELEREL